MHCVLAVPYSPGDLDPGVTYSAARLSSVSVRRAQKLLIAECTWGDWDGTAWTDGQHASTMTYSDADYDAVLAAAVTVGDDSGEALERACLDRLIADGDLAGTVAAGG